MDNFNSRNPFLICQIETDIKRYDGTPRENRL